MAQSILNALMGAVLGLAVGFYLGARSQKSLPQENLNQPEQVAAQTQCVPPVNTNQVSAPVTSESLKEDLAKSNEESIEPGVVVAPVSKEVTQAQVAQDSTKRDGLPNYTSPNMNLENVQNEAEIKDFLKGAEIKDLYRSIPDSLPIGNRRGELEFLNGRFVGTAKVLDDGRSETWDITMTLDAKIISGKLVGNEEIILSTQGREFSKKSGKGVIKDFRELPGDDKMLIIETGPNTYLQVYYLKSSDSMIGNVYRPNEGVPRVVPVGTLQLYRR